MMDLADPKLKTARAKEHLDALEREWTIFKKSQPCTFRGKDNIQTGMYQVKIEIIDPPTHLSIIAGDIFFCLRSALDQLVWALATHATGKYAKHTQFPIFDLWNKKTLTRFNEYLSGVPIGAIAIIDSLQPHRRGDRASIKNDLLWQLNKLCNIDKHRRIPVHGNTVDFRLPSGIPRNLVVLDDDGIMNFPLSMKDKVQFHPDITIDVIFGDTYEGIEINGAGINRIYEFITNDVIPRFAGFFT